MLTENSVNSESILRSIKQRIRNDLWHFIERNTYLSPDMKCNLLINSSVVDLFSSVSF